MEDLVGVEEINISRWNIIKVVCAFKIGCGRRYKEAGNIYGGGIYFVYCEASNLALKNLCVAIRIWKFIFFYIVKIPKDLEYEFILDGILLLLVIL